MGTSFRGTEAAPTFSFQANQKVGAASVRRRRGKIIWATRPPGSKFQFSLATWNLVLSPLTPNPR